MIGYGSHYNTKIRGDRLDDIAIDKIDFIVQSTDKLHAPSITKSFVCGYRSPLSATASAEEPLVMQKNPVLVTTKDVDGIITTTFSVTLEDGVWSAQFIDLPSGKRAVLKCQHQNPFYIVLQPDTQAKNGWVFYSKGVQAKHGRNYVHADGHLVEKRAQQARTSAQGCPSQEPAHASA